MGFKKGLELGNAEKGKNQGNLKAKLPLELGEFGKKGFLDPQGLPEMKKWKKIAFLVFNPGLKENEDLFKMLGEKPLR